MWAALEGRVDYEKLHGKATQDTSAAELASAVWETFGISFYIVLDEIQELYTREPQGKRGRFIIGQMLDLGKNSPTAITVLGGSSVHTKRYAFQEDLDAFGKDVARWVERYPDLNNSVFKAHTLMPLRTRKELVEAGFEESAKEPDALAGFEESAKEPDALADLFFTTDGVGRDLSGQLTAPPKFPTDTHLLSICYLAKQGFEEHRTKLEPLTGGRKLEPASITLLTTQLVTDDDIKKLNERPDPKRLQVFKSMPQGVDVSWLCKADGSTLPLIVETDVEALLPEPYRHHWALSR
jgi:hypothetical protein